MSAVPPSTPRRGTQTQRASHLRHVSNGSSNTNSVNSRPVTAVSDTGTVQHNPLPQKSRSERKCTLWIHEETISRDEVVINLGLFPGVQEGDLMAIVPLKTDSGVRDFLDTTQAAKLDGDALSTVMQRERSSSNPNSPGAASGTQYDVDLKGRCLFIAKDMSKEMEAKQPNLEISVAKQIADIFCLKARSQVLVITVCLVSSRLVRYLAN